MQWFWNWLDDRTGFRPVVQSVQNRILPNGPSWGFTSASCLLWLFIIELFTGLLLMTTYSPSATGAWASVHFIDSSPAGSFIRGIHYFAAHALIIALAIHVIRVLFTAAFRAPRELVWITGLILLPLVVVLAVTGNPLGASQKGLAQIEVEANILGSTPVLGPILRSLLLGGDEVGQLTLLRLYSLHVGLVPLLVLGLLAIHLTQIYRHSLSATGTLDLSRTVPYWPYQSVRNMIVLTAVLGIISILAVRWGAPLDAPADPDLAYVPRPEWYFRCLFELRRYFSGDWEFVATLLIPLAVLLFFLSLPLFEWLLPQPLSFSFRAIVVLVGVGSWSWLTWTSFERDWHDAEYLASQAAAEKLAQRVRQLADHQPIPPEGASTLLRHDPQTRGPQLFARHCASCHPHADPAGAAPIAADSSAPNLYGFGTLEWMEKVLDPAALKSPAFFGRTKFAAGDMVSHIEGLMTDADDPAAMRQKLRQAAQTLAAEAQLLSSEKEKLETDSAAVAEGRKLLTSDLGCIDCHRFHDQGELGSAPDLTGYGSREWLAAMIANPEAERFYPDGHNDRMPAFAKHPQEPKQNTLTADELDLLVSWLRGEE